MNDGGPAFPQTPSRTTVAEYSHGQEGMSLRDYFAAQIITGVTARIHVDEKLEQIARECYELADAMLAARESSGDRQRVKDLINQLPPMPRQERSELIRKMGRCAWCEGEFPEDALNYRTGDPACSACYKAHDLANVKPVR